MRVLHRSLWIAFILGLCAPISSVLRAGDNIQGSGNLQRSAETVGEKVPSEDDVIKGLHSLGLINGRTNIFRCASPVKDLIEDQMNGGSDPMDQAKARMKRLYDLGIRTVISLEDPLARSSKDAAAAAEKIKKTTAVMALEKRAAKEIGLTYVSCPLANAGEDSLEKMSDEALLKQLDSVTDDIFRRSRDGGVIFHCSAGHDRAGIVAAYMRIKYQHWPVDEAIAEMRRYGHNWPKYSRNGGVSSWHEEHLRAIERLLQQQTP